jgi:hypothetical protein
LRLFPCVSHCVVTRRGDLSDGQLYALRLTELSDEQQLWDPENYLENVGDFEWWLSTCPLSSPMQPPPLMR